MARVLQSEYRPSETEPFMNPRQLEYFKMRLITWRDQILQENKEALDHMKNDNSPEADPIDSATNEMEKWILLRAKDRDRKLLRKIDDALKRIDDGSYGYCEETGEPISIGRLEARPIATLSLEAQERHERLEKVQR